MLIVDCLPVVNQDLLRAESGKPLGWMEFWSGRVKCGVSAAVALARSVVLAPNPR
jgi:hypothetical protein